MSKEEGKFNSPLEATIKGITDLFKKQERVGTLAKEDRLDGKKVLITGSSSGLGFAVAKKIAALGAEIIMAVRSGIPEKGEAVKKFSANQNIHMEYVDLADFDSIKKLVAQVKKKYKQIDILICNAAVVVKQSRLTKYDLDEMFSVNYLAKFVLINSMLKENCIKINKEDPSRIIIVSSESHRNPTEFEWDSFGEFTHHKMAKTVERYGYYKLLLTTFSKELERRINKDKKQLAVYSLCPGPVNSNIAREAPAIIQPLMKLVFKIFFRSPEDAAEPVVYLSTSKDMNEFDYDYLFLMSRKPIDDKAEDADNGKRLWEMTDKLLKEHNVSW